MSRPSDTMPAAKTFRALKPRKKPARADTNAAEDTVKPSAGPAITYAELSRTAQVMGLSLPSMTNMIDCLLSCQVQSEKGPGVTVQAMRERFRSGGVSVSMAVLDKYGADNSLTLSGARSLQRILTALKLPEPKWLEPRIRGLANVN